MMRFHLVFSFTCAIVVLGLVGGARAEAQDPRQVRGVVRDESGGAIPGATVEVQDGPNLLQATTDEQGQYRLSPLSGAVHRLRITAPGFAPRTTDVDLRTRRSVSASTTMRLLVAERVEVLPPPMPGAAGGLTSRIVVGEALAALPSDPERMLRRLSEMAGATGRLGEVTVTVDGFRNLLRLPPKEMIQMIRISSNPFAPEFSDPGRIRIEIVTKAGSSGVHGEFKSDFSNGWLTARNAFATREGPVETSNFSGYLAGPLIPKRVSLTGYAGRWRELGSDVVNATVRDPTTGTPAPFVQNVATPRTISNLWIGSDVQLSPLHLLAMSFSRTSEGAENLGLSRGFDLPERAYNQSMHDNAARVSLISFFSAHLLHETRIEYAWNGQLAEALDRSPAVSVLDAFTSGGNQTQRHNESRARNLQLTDHLTFAYRQSTVKVGLQLDTTSRRYNNQSGFGGTFVFGSDVERDGAGFPIRTPSGATTAITALESYHRTLTGVPGYTPSQFSIVRGDPEVEFSQWWLGWFLQQDWPVSPRFSVSYGLRHDLQTYAGGFGGLGPRIGIGWTPDKAARNTVRAGLGLFTGRLNTDLTLDIRRLDGITQQTFVVPRPAFFPTVPDTIAGGLSPQLAVYRRAEELGAPRTLMVTSSFERELRTGVSASASYAYQGGAELTRLINANAPTSGVGSSRPLPLQGPIMQYESTGRSTHHELVLAMRAEIKKLTISGNYAVARTKSDTDGHSTTPADSTQLAGEYGWSASDQRHASFLSVARMLPREVFVSASMVLMSGRPFNITTGRDSNGDTLFTDRPAFAAPGDANAIVTAFGTFNPDPRPGDRVIPRNFGRSAGQARMDLAASKIIQTGPGNKVKMSFGLDIENLLNRVNLAGFNGVLSSPAFGAANRALPPRRARLTLEVTF